MLALRPLERGVVVGTGLAAAAEAAILYALLASAALELHLLLLVAGMGLTGAWQVRAARPPRAGRRHGADARPICTGRSRHVRPICTR
jgi:hypothetical protein